MPFETFLFYNGIKRIEKFNAIFEALRWIMNEIGSLDLTPLDVSANKNSLVSSECFLAKFRLGFIC